MRICIDISEMYKTDFISGIQRVVKEVTSRWIRDGKNVLLLVYDLKNDYFKVVDNEKYCNMHLKDKRIFIKGKQMQISNFGDGDVFFDIDSVWMNPLKRSYLLPRLKQNGCKVAAHIYDIIPVTDSQYCHEFTTLSFLEYIGAQISNADLIISNAQATIDAIKNLIKGTEISSINGTVVKLGSDIKKSQKGTDIRGKIREIPQRGQYVLMVGTIEPRKNHRYILKAFEEQLFAQDICLVFAGRVGWNVEEFVKYMKQHLELNKKFFFIEDASDAEITFLYENSMVVAFPSFNEGFGLPIIEAFDRGAPVLAADIPVLREVGEDYCRYFSLDNTESFINVLQYYLDSPEEYVKDKEKIKQYKRYTWDECAEAMYAKIAKLYEQNKM